MAMENRESRTRRLVQIGAMTSKRLGLDSVEAIEQFLGSIRNIDMVNRILEKIKQEESKHG